MRSIVCALLVLSLSLPLSTVQAVDGARFGNGNLPAGCSTAHEMRATDVGTAPHFLDGCYHMRTGLNNLDTPLIDVLIVPPASPYAERDLRVMRQVVQMYDEGIQYLAPQMGLDWLDGVQFNVVVHGDEITTDPAWDPEIVIVSVNPAVTYVQGIGIDPLDFARDLGFPVIDEPCRGPNPLAPFEAWRALPGFDGHHGSSGTYVEECEGGGSVCYAVNVAIDPVPGVIDDVLGINHFDLVAHEVGHCLSLGHVGDAGDHTAESVPIDDIMSYTHERPPGKCVSSLDVEALALRMSRFLLPQPLVANHANGPRGAFQVQAPGDHFYASSSGLSADCPKPDLGLEPLREPVSFTPTGGVRRAPPTMEITSHADGDVVAAGIVTIEGMVKYGTDPSLDADADHVEDAVDNCPETYNPSQADRDGDGQGDACDPTDGAFPIPDGTITGGITVFSDLNPVAAHNELIATGTGFAGDAKPKFTPGEPVTFQSRFSKAPTGMVTPNVTNFTWHLWNEAGDIVGTASCTAIRDAPATGGDGFNCRAKMTLPREAGYYYASAKLDGTDVWITDTPKEDPDHPGLKGLQVLSANVAPPSPLAQHASTSVTFEDDGDPVNTFYTEDSAFHHMGLDSSERFTLPLTVVSDVKVRLEWSSIVGGDDLDLYVTGVATDKSDQFSTDFEEILLRDVPAGDLHIRVVPYLIMDAVFGAEYTLVAEITPKEGSPVDSDGDGVPDGTDACPDTPAGTPVDATGCPLAVSATERVVLSIGGVVLASQDVDGRGGASFSLPVDLSGHSGEVEVRVAWYDGDWLVREERVTLVVE